jgi:hypothetical protein
MFFLVRLLFTKMQLPRAKVRKKVRFGRGKKF